MTSLREQIYCRTLHASVSERAVRTSYGVCDLVPEQLLTTLATRTGGGHDEHAAAI